MTFATQLSSDFLSNKIWSQCEQIFIVFPAIGSPDLTRCGSEGVDSYKSSGQYAYVEFKTDDSIQASGFRMSYKNAGDLSLIYILP